MTVPPAVALAFRRANLGFLGANVGVKRVSATFPSFFLLARRRPAGFFRSPGGPGPLLPVTTGPEFTALGGVAVRLGCGPVVAPSSPWVLGSIAGGAISSRLRSSRNLDCGLSRGADSGGEGTGSLG